MGKKLKDILAGFIEDKKTSTAGLVPLAGAAAMAYGMYTGAVPITYENVGIVATGASTGIGLLFAKDSVKKKRVTRKKK